MNISIFKLCKIYVAAFDYNVGALKVFMLLSDCNILSLTEFLKNIENDEEVQAIIGDVLDSDEGDHLVEIIKASVSSHMIGGQFEVCFRNYCKDSVDRPELIRKEFLLVLEEQLPTEVFHNAILAKLIDVLLYHEHLKETGLTEVIGVQKQWNNQMHNERLNLLIRILQKVSVNHSGAIFKHILKVLQTNYRVNWFFLLCIIKFTRQTTFVSSELKSKNLFRNTT